jgi:hypothetical protein
MFEESKEKDLTKIGKVKRNKRSLGNLTKISKKNDDGYHDEPTNNTTADSMKNNNKLMSDECLKGSKTSPNNCMMLKTTENSNSSMNKKISAGRGILLVTTIRTMILNYGMIIRTT